MRVVELREVCQITMGQAPNGDSYNDEGRGLPLLAGAGDFGDLYPSPKKFTSALGVRTSQPGDVIVGIRASIGNKVLADGVYCLGRGVAGLRAGPRLDSRYLWNWVTHATPQLAAKGRGATFLQVNKQDVGEMEIPLPPIEEQRRIAAVLDAADALRTKRRQALAKLDTLTQANFIHMFGVCESEGVALGDLAEIQGGLQVTTKRKDMPMSAPYLRVANVHRGRLELSEVKHIRLTGQELERTLLRSGDLLVVEGHGNKDEIGRVAVWTGGIDPCVHQNHLIRVRCNVELAVPRFVEAYMNSRVGRRALLQASNTTSGLNTISSGDVRAVRIPLPALAEQHRFLTAADAIDSSRTSMSSAAGKLDGLFASLQHRAFRGEL